MFIALNDNFDSKINLKPSCSSTLRDEGRRRVRHRGQRRPREVRLSRVRLRLPRRRGLEGSRQEFKKRRENGGGRLRIRCFAGRGQGGW